MGKTNGMTYTEVKEILEDLNGSRQDLSTADRKLVDKLTNAIETGARMSLTELEQLEAIWLKVV